MVKQMLDATGIAAYPHETMLAQAASEVRLRAAGGVASTGPRMSSTGFCHTEQNAVDN